jgi:hypothetical protein
MSTQISKIQISILLFLNFIANLSVMGPMKRSYSKRGVRVPSIFEKGLDPLANFDPHAIEKEDPPAEIDSKGNFPEPDSTRVGNGNDADVFDEFSESFNEPVTAFDIGISDSSSLIELMKSSSIASSPKKICLRQVNEGFIMYSGRSLERLCRCFLGTKKHIASMLY